LLAQTSDVISVIRKAMQNCRQTVTPYHNCNYKMATPDVLPGAVYGNTINGKMNSLLAFKAS